MSRSRAAELARLKLAYPLWTLRRIEPPGEAVVYRAWKGKRVIHARSLVDLDETLNGIASDGRDRWARARATW